MPRVSNAFQHTEFVEKCLTCMCREGPSDRLPNPDKRKASLSAATKKIRNHL